MQTSLICISAVILSVCQILGFIFIIFYESRYFLTTAITLHNIIQTFCDTAILAANITRIERRVLTNLRLLRG